MQSKNNITFVITLLDDLYNEFKEDKAFLDYFHHTWVVRDKINKNY